MFKSSDEEIIEKFKTLKTRVDVAMLLEVKDQSLRYMLYCLRTDSMYSSFEIKKKNGEMRQICAPCKQLKRLQKKLAYILQLIYQPKMCAYGFIKNKNALDNAKQHIKKNEILNIDLKNFFSQFHFGRVVGMLKAPPYSIGEEAAIVIAQICCCKGVLPQGAPTSPIITNMICAPVDNSLMRFAKKYGLKYTRYADDLTFSSYKKCISENIVSASENGFQLNAELQKIFDGHDLIVNFDKISLRNRDARLEVTGIVVNKFPNVKREYYKQLRAILDKCGKLGIYNAAKMYIEKGYCKNRDIVECVHKDESKDLIEKWFKRVIVGKIHFIKQIKGKHSPTFYTLASEANKVFQEEIFDLTYFEKVNKILEKNMFILQCECGGDCIQGSAFYVPDKGLLTSYHVTEKGDTYRVRDSRGILINKIASRAINLIKENKEIDYALYTAKMEDAVDVTIGNSKEIEIGDTVIIAGFPDYQLGETITKETCQITGKKTLFEAPFYKVSGRIVHGASGGIVLNTSGEIVGLIKGGVSSLSEDDTNDNHGFVPIHLVMENIELEEA